MQNVVINSQFILHYADIAKGKVDAFLIGSELVAIARIRDKNGRFSAIDELVLFAARMKEIWYSK